MIKWLDEKNLHSYLSTTNTRKLIQETIACYPTSFNVVPYMCLALIKYAYILSHLPYLTDLYLYASIHLSHVYIIIPVF